MQYFRSNWLRVGIVALVTALALPFGAAAVKASDWAVIFMYHRFGESEFPTSNIRIDQFEGHLKELATGGYTVLPVPEILESLRTGASLPDRTVGITIDDAYKSVYVEAWPRLKAAGLPFRLLW